MENMGSCADVTQKLRFTWDLRFVIYFDTNDRNFVWASSELIELLGALQRNNVWSYLLNKKV